MLEFFGVKACPPKLCECKPSPPSPLPEGEGRAARAAHAPMCPEGTEGVLAYRRAARHNEGLRNAHLDNALVTSLV